MCLLRLLAAHPELTQELAATRLSTGFKLRLAEQSSFQNPASFWCRTARNKRYPIDAIPFRMEQQGLTPKDLEVFMGPSGRGSEVLNRKRRSSLPMVRRLHQGLHIPYESLLASA